MNESGLYDLIDSVLDSIAEMREKSIEPGAIIVGRHKLKNLEYDAASKFIVGYDQPSDHINNGSIGRIKGVDMYLDPYNPDCLYVVPERTIEDLFRDSS